MSTPGNAPIGNGALELPPFSLDVQALDLGNEIKAVGLELVETENREPVRGAESAEIWSEIFPALAAKEAFAVDFFSHIERVREFSKARQIEWREAAERCLVIAQPSVEQLRQLCSGRGTRKPAIAARLGCLPGSVRAVYLLRGLRAGRWVGHGAEPRALAQRDHPACAPGGRAL